MSLLLRASRLVAAIAALAIVVPCAVRPADAQGVTANAQTITGTVVDARTALPLAGVRVTAQGRTTASATTDANGHFSLSLPPGDYTLLASGPGYQTAQSDDVPLIAGTPGSVTLSLQRDAGGGRRQTRVIGRTSTNSHAALQTASVVYRNISTDDLVDQGSYRIADALKTQPGISVSGGNQSAAPADDIHFSIRGIGALETQTLLDGHPLAQGIPGGFSFELSPIAAVADTRVVYGAGSDLYPVSAIGGVIDMRTIEPTRTMQSNLITNYGTFAKTGTILQTTGTIDKLGYAFAVGSQGTNGYFRNARVYNFSAATDPSGGPGTPGYQSGVYNEDTSSNGKTVFGKLRYQLAPNTRLTAQVLSEGFYDDKTGNGDTDYATPQLLLANYAANPPANNGGCPAGQYSTKGAVPCLTQGQYVANYSGWNGAGPAFQTLSLADYSARLDTKLGKVGFSLEGFGNRYTWHYDRSGQLPAAADGSSFYTNDTYSSSAGFTATTSYDTAANALALGLYGANYTYLTSTNSGGSIGYGGRPAKEVALFLRDSYQLPNIPVTAFFNAWERRSDVTDTSSFNPRLALVWQQHASFVRVAAGSTTTQPDLGSYAPFTPAATGSLIGTISNGKPVTIGNIPGGALKPESGVDEEVSFGHRFGRDSIAQVTLYNTNVFNKIYSTAVPISQLPAGTIPASVIAFYRAFVDANGGTNSTLMASGPLNLAQVQARGIDLNGNQNLIAGFSFDYDYAVQSTLLKSADINVLQNNLSFIPGAQLPDIPLHRFNLGLGWEHRGYTAHLNYFHESENNTRHLPSYGYFDLVTGAQVGPGRLAIAVGNLFNQRVDYRGLEYSGYPHALNQYADPVSGYLPQIGNAATEQFGLPARQINLTYSLRTK